MKIDHYRDLQLLHELSQNPRQTQRDLGKRTGLALGLINPRLHQLSTRGLIRVTVEERKRIQYQVTPSGLMEKGRLIEEYLSYSFQYYRDARRFLSEQLMGLAARGVRRILLVGTGELAEISYLTIQEAGLTLVGVVGERDLRPTFFNLPVQSVREVRGMSFDRVIVAAGGLPGAMAEGLSSLGITDSKLIRLPSDPSAFSRDGLRDWFVPDAPVARDLNPSMTDVVILCGGRGTRLGTLTSDVPKPLLKIGGEPFLLRLIHRLQREGFGRIVLAAHYLPEKFEEFLSVYSMDLPFVELLVEPEPLGTGGALRHAADHVASDTLVALNGDTWVQQPLRPVLEEHAGRAREFTVVAVKAERVEGQALKKGVWRIGPLGEILNFETRETVQDGWVNAGCYVLDRKMLSFWPVGSYSLEANLSVLLRGRKTGAFLSSGRMLDIGLPATYQQAASVLESYDSEVASIHQGSRTS